ncbi:MAG: FAD-dependent oxidoreductase [Chloroflexi bacterium]|nr:FAD-dependent oxidoreductase [Chloroflexota bacterium]MBV9895667.1 FAD-dependent oxidoreductase [Chloroflexota bacterium]
MTAVARLDAELDGELFSPGSAGYEAFRRPANPNYAEVYPRLLLRCGSAADVARGIQFARETGMLVVPRGGGHCFAGRSSTEGLVLDLRGLDRVRVRDDGRAILGAGACLGQMYAALHAHGRTVPAGCGASVGVAGLTLGGGIGLLGRMYGLTCDWLVSAQVVLADGRIVECDAQREPDLFWALRGAGGGQFGVVTSLIFDTLPEPTTTRFELRVFAGPLERLIATWQRWAPGGPDDLTANLTIVAEVGRRPYAVVFGAALLDERLTRARLLEFCDLAGVSPEVDICGGLPYSHLKSTFEHLDAREELASGVRIRSELFAHPMHDATIDSLLSALVHGHASGRRQLSFTALGGAYNRVSQTATAFAHRQQRFMLEHIIAGEPGDWVDRSWGIARADGSGRVYPNFPDLLLEDWQTAYHADNFSRLVAAKRAYDPDRLFTFPQSI